MHKKATQLTKAAHNVCYEPIHGRNKKL